MRHESRERDGGGERENVRGLMSPRSVGRERDYTAARRHMAALSHSITRSSF